MAAENEKDTEREGNFTWMDRMNRMGWEWEKRGSGEFRIG
jgi:hypothetical protein